MRPRPLGLDMCALPDLPTMPDLAQWLGLPLDRLLWLSPETPLGSEHYRYKLQPKRTGGLRLLEIPKVDLKRVQRTIHAGLLQHVPVHEAAHGFVAKRSVATHAAAHAGQAVVIKFDLQDFFGSIRAAQVAAVWRTLGYPSGVARCLVTLCTHRTAQMVVERMRDDGGLDWLGAKRLRAAHLLQGAPTSPALANLCAFGLDLRLDGLAWVFGAAYTRYADDLVFSGSAALRPQFRALKERTPQHTASRLRPPQSLLAPVCAPRPSVAKPCTTRRLPCALAGTHHLGEAVQCKPWPEADDFVCADCVVSTTPPSAHGGRGTKRYKLGSA